MRVWACILLFLLVSCQHNAYVQPVRLVNNTCDSVGVAYYGKGGIKSLFEDNCYRCHATSVVNEESLNLEDTASLRNYLGRDYRQDHIYGSKSVSYTHLKVVDSDVTSDRVELNIKGQEVFTAGMIGEALPNFEVMNPELLICTMDPNTSFHIELHIGKGRGYVPAEENRSLEAPVGLIAIDSIYTPIKNVKYSIENTRVEQRTDFEKLIMEVVTDGTIPVSYTHLDVYKRQG